MNFLFVCGEIVLRNLAQLEFRFCEHRGSKPFRRLYLRFMRVSHGKVFTFGLDFYLRNRGNLRIGERSGFGSFCRIWNYAPIEIGEDLLAGGGLTLNTGGHDTVTLASQGGPIKIGNRVWCGVNVTILAGVTIGDDVVIGAGSLVTRNVPSNTIVAGVPARVIGRLERNEEALRQVRIASL